MKKSSTNRNRVIQGARSGNSANMLLPALVAVGGSLAAIPANALELGDITVHSTLGQPLRASIAVALAPHEQLTSTCVSLQQGQSSAGLPTITRATIGVANGVISLSGNTAIREPMLSLNLNIRCPYTPNLSREYMLFVDPAGTAAVPIAAPVAVTTNVQAVRQPAATPRRSTTAAKDQSPIGIGTRYQAKPGDSLGEIAQRIAVADRPNGLWPAVTAIFEANPDAFMDNDPNKLKAGSWLSIPDFGGAPAIVAAATSVTTTTDVQELSTSVAVNEAAAYTAAFDVATSDAASDASAPTASTATLQPGDVILESDNSFVAPAGSKAVETIILDTPLESPKVASNPNGTTMSVQTRTNDSASSNWLLWLAGSGVAIIAGLLLFGRRFRDRYTSAPIAAVAVPQPARRRSDNDTENMEAISDLEFGLPDDAPTEENLILDADLIEGTGLSHGTEMHVAQDFGFAATTSLDMELPEEMSSGGITRTDMIPPLRIDTASILESEVLPDEDDYDMSVIVDATKMRLPDEVTERDLKAVPINMSDETLIRDDYTVSKEVDFDILEQDYEDELTATQVLNMEIAKAAAELATRMDDDSTGVTTQMPRATVTELDVTAQLPARDETISDLDDTGIREEQTAEFSLDDKTVEMPANDADVTAEMPVKTGKTGR